MDIALKIKDISVDRLMFLGFCAAFFLIPLGTSPFIIASFLTLSIWILSGRFLRDKSLWRREKWALPLLVFISLHWIGLLYTDDLPSGLKFAMRTHHWLFAFVMLSVSFHRYPPRMLINSFLAGLSVAAVSHILFFFGVVHAAEKYRSSFLNPITYILLLIYGLVLLSYYFGKARELRYRMLYGALMLLFLFSISLFAGAPGRTAVLSLAAMTPLIVYNCVGQRSFQRILVVTLLLAGAIFFLPVIQSSFSDAISQVSSYGENPKTSIGLRLHMWSGALRIFMENPLFGIGTGGYEMEMAKHPHPLLGPLYKFSQPHNSFLYMAVSFGVMGLAALIWLFIEFLKASWARRTRLPGFAALSFCLIMIVASITDTQIIQVHSGMLFAMLLGLQASSRDVEA